MPQGVPRSRLSRGPGRRKQAPSASFARRRHRGRRPGGECRGAQLGGVRAKDSSCYRRAGARGVRWCLPLCVHEGTLVLGVYEVSRRAACEAPVEQRVQVPGVAGARRPPSQPPPFPRAGGLVMVLRAPTEGLGRVGQTVGSGSVACPQVSVLPRPQESCLTSQGFKVVQTTRVRGSIRTGQASPVRSRPGVRG